MYFKIMKLGTLPFDSDWLQSIEAGGISYSQTGYPDTLIINSSALELIDS